MPRLRQSELPKRPNNRGFPRIKRSYGLVGGEFIGQINVSSGTTDPKEYARLIAMLDLLADQGQGHLLAQIRDSVKRTAGRGAGKRSHFIRDVYRSLRDRKHIPNILGVDPLADAIPEWIESARTRTGLPLSDRTKQSYRTNAAQFLNFAASEGRVQRPTNSDIPLLLKRYREWCADDTRQYWTPFNQVKTMLRSYSRETQPDREESDLYRAVKRVPGLSTARKRERRTLLVSEVRELMAKLPTREAVHVWNMVCLAVRPDEYRSGRWKVESDETGRSYVRVRGTKNRNAERVVPLVQGVKSGTQFADSSFRRHLRAVAGDSVVPRDFRSTGLQWMKWAGIDRARMLQYFGHSMRGIAERYEVHDLEPWLQTDAALLNAYIQAELAKA